MWPVFATGPAFTLLQLEVTAIFSHALLTLGRAVYISVGGGAAPPFPANPPTGFASKLAQGIIHLYQHLGVDGEYSRWSSLAGSQAHAMAAFERRSSPSLHRDGGWRNHLSTVTDMRAPCRCRL